MWISQKPETAFTLYLIGKKIGMFILKVTKNIFRIFKMIIFV